MAGIGKMDGIWELRSIYRWDNESIFLGIIVIYLSLFIWDLSTCTYLSICACPSVCPSVRLFVRPSVLYSMREIIFSREMFSLFFFHPITKRLHTSSHTSNHLPLAQNSWTSKNWMISDPKYILPLFRSPQNYPIFQYFSPPSIPAVDPLILPFSWATGHLHGYILW